ncbi:TetR/AcrR family transcriptional regulator [Nocardia australiensis]|uniref:TetR/AcrR family transcriptional regulator n=1 Tax=Nocardia australiensis TaxID=2887191 RepID=UPI001D14F130|nr:TetR/AcrR family transcriptional regulator [Nocardia australiensis]
MNGEAIRTPSPDRSSTRTRNPRGQGERLRGEILAAASRLLSELGGEQAVTIRGVARAAGIAPASIYEHFADKAALVDGLVEYDYHRLTQALTAAGVSGDPRQALTDQMHAYCRFALENPGHYRLLLTRRKSVQGNASLSPALALVAGTFERCAKTGYPLRMSAERAAVMVFVGVHGRVALFHSDDAETDTAAALLFADELSGLMFLSPDDY